MVKVVLVVDDDALVRGSVSRILQKAGYTVLTASDVAGAIAQARATSFHAALVDYDLTGEDGLSVLSRLREMQPSCLRILMTGHTDFPMVVDAVNQGEVLRVVRKPFDSTGLTTTLSDAFRSARRMAQLATQTNHESHLQEQRALDEVFDDDLLSLAVQPIVAARAPTHVIAYEALLRSRHGILNNPLAVIAAAERHERIGPLGSRVFELAQRWLHWVPDPIGLFINLHPEQLANQELLERDLAPLLPHRDRITLEITERSRIQGIHGWEQALASITDAGFAIAIDDLGAGYNSLGMLADLQPRYIKLDMQLVRNIDVEPRKQRLVQLMVTFADATNSLLIAEGVETAAEAAVLADSGTHLLQGYYFAKPAVDHAPLLQTCPQWWYGAPERIADAR